MLTWDLSPKKGPTPTTNVLHHVHSPPALRPAPAADSVSEVPSHACGDVDEGATRDHVAGPPDLLQAFQGPRRGRSRGTARPDRRGGGPGRTSSDDEAERVAATWGGEATWLGV